MLGNIVAVVGFVAVVVAAVLALIVIWKEY
jgi:hypothetical protein